jgi:hypothetical protein
MKNRSDIVAESRFTCGTCDKEAGHIRLFGSLSSSYVRRTSFTSVLSSAVPAEQFSELRSAIEQRDARRLHGLDLEYAPFFCPQCDAIYCGDHWKRWDVFDEDDPSWHDSIRGRCPKGHERMLED